MSVCCQKITKEVKETGESSSIPSDLSTESNKNDDNVPETSKVADNTTLVIEHYNGLLDKGIFHRNQSRIVHMRNFNNWIKSMLIEDHLIKIKHNKSYGASINVLDMCCGKGGDLFKWRQGNITHLICADIADISVDQCQQRYNDILHKTYTKRRLPRIFTAEFIKADCTKVRLRQKFKDASIPLDCISCQFAFHYSFETLQQAECMLRNASESLKPGGYFIGTIPDAYDLVSRWQKSNDNKFGNDIYNVEFLCDKSKPPIFGAKYNFHLEGVVNCPEFLVHLPTLCKLASKFGLELVSFERFDDYYQRMKYKGKFLLNKMEGLESYPPHHGSSLLGHPSRDYQHAIQYTQNIPEHHKIGTLSQSEWEVISLYAVFVFQKLKTVWNSDGKPEYVKL